MMEELVEGELLTGFVQAISENKLGLSGYVQVVNVHKNNKGIAYKLKISDQIHMMWMLLSRNYNSLVEENKIKAGTIIEVESYETTIIMNRFYIFVVSVFFYFR